MTGPSVAVVVPSIGVGPLLERCIAECRRCCPGAELIVVVDDPTGAARMGDDVRVITSPSPRIGAKRNLGVASTTAAVVAFVDSDAYPAEGWLDRAAALLAADPGLGAVGGPNVSPEHEPPSERYVGNANRSPLVAGWWAFRKDPGAAAREVLALPSCNLVVRRDEFLAMGGMREDLFTAEDTDYCSRLVRDGRRILFDPGVLVFHKNRRLSAFVVQRYTFGVAMVPLLAEAEHPDAAYRAVSYAVAAFAGLVVAGPLLRRSARLRPWWDRTVGVYALAVVAEAARQAHRPADVPGTAVALAVGNLAPGLGFLLKAAGLSPDLHGVYRNDR